MYESNKVVNNVGAGIVHEVSYMAKISNNIVKGNANVPTPSLWFSQIVLANSQNVEVYGNTVEVPSGGANAIGLVNEPRGTGSQGVWVAANNYIHNNAITFLGRGGATGLESHPGSPDATGNRFDYNTYILAAGGTVHWMWLNRMNWKSFVAAGEEGHGVYAN